MLAAPSLAPRGLRRWITPLAGLLLIAILSPLLPASFDLQRPTALAPSAPLPSTPAAPVLALPPELVGKTELLAQRTAATATYDLGNGGYAVLHDLAPLHYQDETGVWQPINPAFAALPTGWLNTTNALHTSLAASHSTAKISQGAAGLGWTPQALLAGTSIVAQQRTDDDSGVRSSDGTVVQYRGDWSQRTVRDQWRSARGRAEYTLRLDALPRLGVAPATLDLRVQLRLRPGTTLQSSGQSVALPFTTNAPLEFVAANGDAVILQPPSAYEQRNPSQRSAGSYSVSAGDAPDLLELRVQTPWQWLSAAERRLPVVIDPIFQIRDPNQGKSAAYTLAGAYINNDPNAPLALGTYQNAVYRTLVKFDLPPLAGGTLTDAYLVGTPTEQSFVELPAYATTIQAFPMTNGAWTTSNSANPANALGPLIGSAAMSYNRSLPNTQAVSAIWNVTAQAQSWQANAATNFGLLLRDAQEGCTNCAGFEFAHKPATLTDADLAYTEQQTQTTPAVLGGKTGGLRLVVKYTGAALTNSGITSATPPADAPYYHVNHEFTVPAATTWRAVVAQGNGSTFGPNPPSQHNAPFGRPLQGSVPLYVGENTSGVVLNSTQVNPEVNTASAVVLNGRANASATFRAQVRPIAGQTPLNSYTIKTVGERASLSTTLFNSTLRNDTFDTGDNIQVFNIAVPVGSNARVDVLVTGYNNLGGDTSLYPYARSLTASLVDGSVLVGSAQSGSRPMPSNAPATGAVAAGSVRLSSGIFTPERSFYGLALGYNGPRIDSYTCLRACSGEFPPQGVERMYFKYTLRITACGNNTFPTSAGVCQQVRCPDAGLVARNSGNFRLWSANGWAGTNDAAISTAAGNSPIIGGVNNGSTAATVAVVGGQVGYTGSAVIVLNDGSNPASVLLIQCNTPGAVPAAYFPVYEGSLQCECATIALVPRDSLGTKLVFPWSKTDQTTLEAVPGLPLWAIRADIGQARGNAVLGRRVNPENAIPLKFGVFWSIGAAGWSSFGKAINKESGTPPLVAGMTLDLDLAFNIALDDITKVFTTIEAETATIRQPTTLGGAAKPIKALIFPSGVPVAADPVFSCYSSSTPISCLDLRAANNVNNRVWQMPDIHTNGEAHTVLYKADGNLEAYSSDHPQATPQAAPEEFSFDAYGASVKVTKEVCTPGGGVETVVRGETRMSIPNMGDGSSPDGAINAAFKLCGGALRETLLEFKSPVGIPVGNSGLFVTGIKGQVTINPSYTSITLGLEFQAAPGGDGGAFKGYGEITIDTRGMFEFQGNAKILGTVDVDGKLWAAWSPLDVGFEMNMHYKVWLSGFMRAHMWEGQGWQNKYSWLPANNQRHIAAQIGATLRIREGQAFSWWFIDIPPSDISFSVEVSFGEFCTNSSCSTFEWGVKGKFSIVGYDVGLYYGFDHGFDFILGNDDHVLIDQYGGPQLARVQIEGEDAQLRMRMAAPQVGDTVFEDFTVDASSEQLMFALGWQAGAPNLTLISPAAGNPEITAANAAQFGAQFLPSADATLVGVRNPASGLWRAKISNLSAGRIEHYKFTYFASKGAPGTAQSRGSFTGLDSNVSGTSQYTIRWTAPLDTPPGSTISLYSTRLILAAPGTINKTRNTPIVRNLPFLQNAQTGAGSYVWNTKGLKNGEYTIVGIVDDGVNSFPAGAITEPDDACNTALNALPPARAFDAARFPGTSTFTATGRIVLNDNTAPGIPAGLAVTPVDGAMLARWDLSSERDLAGYLVTWGIPDAGTSLGVIDSAYVTAVQTPTLRIGGLTNGVQYGVLIQAVDSNDILGSVSQRVVGTPNTGGGGSNPVPFAPTNLGIVDERAGAVRLNWTPPTSGPIPANYRVTYTRLGDTPVIREQVASGASVVISGLPPGATYDFSVAAANSQGWRSVSTATRRFVIGFFPDYAAFYGIQAVASNDDDQDGLTNSEEFNIATNPTRQDSDDDGFSDREERDAGTSAWSWSERPTTATQPRLSIATQELTFRLKKQGAAASGSTMLGLTNIGGGTMRLSFAPTASWINVFTIVGRGTILTADAANLAPGFYTAAVRVTANRGAGGDPLIGGAQCIRVRVWVSPADTDIPRSGIFLPFVRR